MIKSFKGLLLVLALGTAPAAALELRGGVTQIVGSDRYRYVSGTLTLGLDSGWYAKPSFAVSSSSGASTTRNFGLRLGYDGDLFGVGAEASITPRVAGYQSLGVGGDASLYFSPGGDTKSSDAGEKTQDSARKKGLVEAHVGAGGFLTRHSELIPAIAGQAARDNVTNQTDASVFAGAQVLVLDLSAGYTRSYYDKNISERPLQALRAQARGFNPAIFGFPEYKFDAQLIWLLAPVVKPYAAFQYTDYKVDQPIARSYTVGATVKILKVRVKGSYEIYDPGGGSRKSGYYSLGASVAF